MKKCVFCNRESLNVIAENELALAFYDACPASKGHTLVIPKRHVETYFEASQEEHSAIIRLVFRVRDYLEQKYSPDAYNIGANVGRDAGQTVFHFHIHILPRYKGDVEDPRGGLRKIIPLRKSHRDCTETGRH